MELFEKPRIEKVVFEVDDIVTASFSDPTETVTGSTPEEGQDED